MRRSLYLVVLLTAMALVPTLAMASSGKDDKAKMAKEQQAATSFAKMADQVAIGDTIFVTDSSGKEVKGKLLAYSEDTTYIKLGSDDDEVELSQDQVRQIDLQYRDSAWGGALIGMAAGAGGGAVIGAAAGCDTAEMCIGAIAGLGALVGLAAGGITDAVMKSRKPVYANTDQMASLALQIVPVISKNHKGVLVSITF